MSPSPEVAAAAPLPDDVATLQALLLAERAMAAKLAGHNEQLRAIVKELQRALFGRRSEKAVPADQLQLALEDIEQALAEAEAQEEKTEATLKVSRRPPRRVNRGALPRHLPREEVLIAPARTTCPCCGGALHRIGEDVAERLDIVPAQFRVIVTRRPKYGCRACESAVVQAPAPARLIDGGLPTEALVAQVLVAQVLVAKYADHVPLYRQSQIYARQGIELDRSTLADWVGRAAAELRPLHERLLEHLKGAPKLFMDETRAPVLDPGRRRTKTGYLWASARDDRPWAGPDPPAVAYLYAPGRGAEHAIGPLAGFKGLLQVDAYAAYNALADPARADGPVTLAYCWSHVRRHFYEIAQGGDAPLAEEALARIGALFGIERTIRGQSPEQRRAVRLAQTRPLIDGLRAWLEAMLAKVAGGSRIARAIRYALKHRAGLTIFLDDGRVEIDSHVVERAIRPIALNRKNALFAGSDQGGVHWGVIASLIETAKLNAIDPQAYLADVLTRLVNRHPASQIDQL
ncbi:MAG TPA: IS66 family transposase, partial [Solirubrobacterales bacterium]|nr:IS66 family transposase [Solirubrobacterales bacterium]